MKDAPVQPTINRSLVVLLLVSFSLGTPERSSADPITIISAIGSAVLLGTTGEELRDSIDRAHAAASALLQQADALGKKRLEQIDNILKNTVGQIIDKSEAALQAAIMQATKEMRELEKKILSDLTSVIWQAECAINRSQDQIINQSIQGVIPSFLRNNTRIVSLPYPFMLETVFWPSKQKTEIEIDLNAGYGADTIFNIIEEAYIKSLLNVKDSDQAFGIVSAYMNLSSLSRLTICKFPGVGEAYWTRKYVHYQALLRPWVDTLNVEN